MKTRKNYLLSLSPEDFATVSSFMIRDQFGISHPDGGKTCDPPCSGSGPTANGYWACVSSKCVWIPQE